MKKLLQRYGFVLASTAFLLHQLLQKGLQVSLSWLDGYLDDFLCLPILLSIWQWERSRLWNWPRLQTQEVVACILLACFVFEVIYPQLSTAYTADWWDCVAYLLGGLLFLWVNPHDQPKSSYLAGYDE